MKNLMILTVFLLLGVQTTNAFAKVKCQDIESNSNYFLISNGSFSGSAGWKVTFGRTRGFNQPVLYQDTYQWGAGSLTTVPGSNLGEYSAHFEHFGLTEGISIFEIDYVMGKNDFSPYFVVLKVSSGFGDYLTYKLTCSTLKP